MIFAQKYASLNCRVIARRICQHLNLDYAAAVLGETESVHNFIDFKDLILRKGAIAARKGQRCIIALNMRDCVLLCRGLGNMEWNESCAHGAGRVMTRKQATSE
jgi:RNA-splicing ligase RtcB